MGKVWAGLVASVFRRTFSGVLISGIFTRSHRVGYGLWAIALALVIGLSGGIEHQPALANVENMLLLERSHVSVDGVELFEVGASGNFLATERAKGISRILEQQLDDILREGSSAEITIDNRNGQTVLLLNNRYIMSVTQADTTPGMLTEERAADWQGIIEETLERSLEERTPGYLTRAGIQVAIAALIAGALHFGLGWLGSGQRRKQLRQDSGNFDDATPATETSAQPRYSILSVSRMRQVVPQRSLLLLLIGFFQVSVWVLAAVYCAQLFPPTRRIAYWIYSLGRVIFSANLLRLGDSNISLVDIVALLISVVLWWVVVSWLAGIVQRHILPLTTIDPTLKTAMSSYAQYLLLIVGVIIIVSVVGLDLGAIAIILGGFGVGIGFALQNIAKDFISGIIMLVERPVKVGEMVQVGDTTGWVKHIGPRFTELSHLDRYLIRVPNSQFVDGSVSNFRRSGLLRLKVDVGVAYGSDVMLVRDLMLEAALEPHPEILRHPNPDVLFLSWDDSAIVLRLIAFIREPTKGPRLEALLRERIHAGLEKYDIEVPFPQRDLNLSVPHLDRMAETWLEERGQQVPPKPEPTRDRPQVNTGIDWDSLIRDMRGRDGLPIRDRTAGFRTYRQCFTGTAAVRWLMRHERATQEEAVQIGQQLLARGIIHHVLDEHNFENASYFYRFRDDDPLVPESGVKSGVATPPPPPIKSDPMPDADAALEEEAEALCHDDHDVMHDAMVDEMSDESLAQEMKEAEGGDK
ncbi:MAG: mechanosensitive ion channel domain-containing protein [Cyanobacteria bacterium P01_D01_bin.73]